MRTLHEVQMLVRPTGYTIDTAVGFLKDARFKKKAVFMDGKIHTAYVCNSKTPAGVKYRRLLRLKKRLKNR